MEDCLLPRTPSLGLRHSTTWSLLFNANSHWNFCCGRYCLVVKLWLTLTTPWTVAHQAPLSMGFSRHKYWSERPFSTPGDLPNLGIEPTAPSTFLALQLDSLLLSHPCNHIDSLATTYMQMKQAPEGTKGWLEPQASLRIVDIRRERVMTGTGAQWVNKMNRRQNDPEGHLAHSLMPVLKALNIYSKVVAGFPARPEHTGTAIATGVLYGSIYWFIHFKRCSTFLSPFEKNWTAWCITIFKVFYGPGGWGLIPPEWPA